MPRYLPVVFPSSNSSAASVSTLRLPLLSRSPCLCSVSLSLCHLPLYPPDSFTFSLFPSLTFHLISPYLSLTFPLFFSFTLICLSLPLSLSLRFHLPPFYSLFHNPSNFSLSLYVSCRLSQNLSPSPFFFLLRLFLLPPPPPLPLPFPTLLTSGSVVRKGEGLLASHALSVLHFHLGLHRHILHHTPWVRNLAQSHKDISGRYKLVAGTKEHQLL